MSERVHDPLNRRGGFALKEVYSVHMPPLPGMCFTDSLQYVHRRAFYDQHHCVAISMIVIVLIFPILGLLLSGLFGAIAGALASFAAYFLAPYVLRKLGI
jgi:hypothetical protein